MGRRGTKIRLTRKLAAERLDGIDVSQSREGDVLNVTAEEAKLLIAEGWAAHADRERPPPRKNGRNRRR